MNRVTAGSHLILGTPAVASGSQEWKLSEADSHNDRATKLAEQVLDDFRGAGFYADSKILADIIRSGSQTNRDDERNAVEIGWRSGCSVGDSLGNR